MIHALAILVALALPPRTQDVIAQWDGPGCVDEILWHWGMGEKDDTTAVENPEDDCLRSFHRRHEFKSSVRRLVWVTFMRKGEDLGQSASEWVTP